MNEIVRVGAFTPQDLMVLGLERIAYIRPIEYQGESAFSVHAADGTQIAIAESRELAAAAIRHHEMEALSVH